MKAHELRDLSTAELEARLNDEESALQNMRFTKSVTGQLENPARMKSHRREIARLKTVLNEKLSAEQA
ncbi:MAG: 50S ribosomal protein L29 [Balneolaceae bacterium]|nr:50S ribosomal protein L29 [Balneolaceae bacterium]